MEQPSSKKPTACEGCGVQFPSRSAVFKHLRDTKGACLSQEAYNGFCQYMIQTQREKAILLYGYTCNGGSDGICSGEQAAKTLVKVLLGQGGAKYTRSHSHLSRGSDIVRQDDGTGAVTELMAIHLPPIFATTHDEWIQQTNAQLAAANYDIRVLGRRLAPAKLFNAERDASHRRSEYVLPVEFLHTGKHEALPAFLQKFFSFHDGEVNGRPPMDTIMYLFRIKKIMQSLQTKVVVLDKTNKVQMMEKDWHRLKRQRNLKGNKGSKQEDKGGNTEDKNEKQSTSADNKNEDASIKHLLKRRRFHNFTPKAMAHETLVYRRLDRCHHRATLRPTATMRPFMVISLTGDMFLTGQVQRVVGLVIALARGLVDDDFVDLVFDENYPHLVPTPPVPAFAMYMSETGYSLWEGKAKAVLIPRTCDVFSEGFNEPAVLKRVEEWRQHVRTGICQQWEEPGESEGRLVSVHQWIETVLEPWALNARQQLEDYRIWKRLAAETNIPEVPKESLYPLESSDKTVPAVYERVLHLLREVDRSGRWPATSTKRQLVMVSTTRNQNEKGVAPDLSTDLVSLEDGQRASSAYIYEEGEGGASGSFTVGAFPNGQPKANEEFRDLMRAAFELEIALRPGREPSSTIAINRNAQFRPHTDSGAGAGQSTSLIVGLGDYSGGDLVLEGEQKIIRYNPIEFNGWTQRHWTMPFKGERFSLVWFTPKGCEGVRGIDLCS